MHAWEQIQVTVDYIEEHISEDIKIQDLAKMAALSQFYFQRLFSRLVKKPVNEYIKLRRLAKASEVLLSSEQKIIDIALDFGFSSHETFTRTFKSAFGMTPEEFRKNPVRLNNFVKPQIFLNYALVDENVPLITDGIVLEITRKCIITPQFYIGLITEEPIIQIPGGGETGIDNLGRLWDTFHELKFLIAELKKDGEELGVSFPGTNEGYYSYFAGAEATNSIKCNNYSTWELKPGEYIVCSFEAEDFEHLITDAVYKAQKYLFETWLPNHKIATHPFVAERYKSHDKNTTSMEILVFPLSSSLVN